MTNLSYSDGTKYVKNLNLFTIALDFKKPSRDLLVVLRH